MQACATHDEYFVAGIVREPFSHGEHLQHGFGAANLEDAGFLDRTDNGDRMAFDGGDENTDVRIFHVLAQPYFKGSFELAGGQAG